MRVESGRQGGHTRWLRFGAVMGAGGVAAAALVIGMAQGAIAASFAASGSVLKVNATSLTASGITGYGGEVKTTGGAEESVTLGVDSAQVKELCGEFSVGDLPILGKVSIGIRTPSADAQDLIADVGAAALGEAEIKSMQIGFDASTVGGTRGSSALKAGSATAKNVDGDSWAASAGTIKVKGATLALAAGGDEVC